MARPATQAMQMKRVNRWEMTGALSVLGVGLFVLVVGSGYSFGSPSRMGPGFFPVVIGAVLMIFGIGLVLEALRDRSTTEGIGLRPFGMVMLSIAAFAVLMENAGLIPATVAMVVLSALAERPFRPVRTLLLAVAVSAMGVGVFIYALGLPLKPLAL